jgi:excisionase family DNA binding protein
MTSDDGAIVPLFLNAKQVGQLMGWRKSRVYEAAAAGLIPSVRMGRRYLFPRRGIEALENMAVERTMEKLRAA